MLTARTDHLIDLALDEDAGLGDLTSRAIFPANHRSRAYIEATQDLVICGLAVAERVFVRVDPLLRVRVTAKDGQRIKRGGKVLEVSGPTASLLTAERTALNFLQRLSGVATQARRFADAVAGTDVRIVDTRKTTPGWRALEKYAVRCGGCHNHRSSLGEHVLIKDNHIAAAGSLTRAVQLTRAEAPHLARIEVEAKTLAEVKEALRVGADVVLLDNMSPEMVRQSVAILGGGAVIEVSGGVRFETLRDYAIPGVDVISIGALTHSAPAADLSLTLVGPKPARRARRR
ncbi:MAG TPA: carboxylating nicotinate-nucleotide diphosphorylase [Opitutaceae bacterium]|nr:carboxylating nicotinate-nucleotide diphosphorylase [Opitutaceae bacterium]